MEWSISAVNEEHGAPKNFVAVQGDITAFRRRLAEAEVGARTDALTGLANRRAYDARRAAALAQPDIVLGLLAIDIDHFKSVNDTHGHGAGDAVLMEVSRRMASVAATTPGSFLARTGGEEFSLLVPLSRQERGAEPGGTGAGARGLTSGREAERLGHGALALIERHEGQLNRLRREIQCGRQVPAVGAAHVACLEYA